MHIELSGEMIAQTSRLNRVDIFKYWDYRKFLRDFLGKSNRRKMSMRQLSKKIGLKSSGHLSMILSGNRNLNEAMTAEIAAAIHLSESETDYFFLLVEFNQSTQDRNRTRLFDAIKKQQLIASMKTIQLPKPIQSYEAFLNLIFQALGTNWSKLPTEKMAESIGISHSDLLSALTRLEKIGLAKVSNGIWAKSNDMIHISIGNSDDDRRFAYKRLFEIGTQKLFAGNSKDIRLEVRVLTLSPEGLKELNEQINKWILERTACQTAEAAPGAKLFHLHVSICPIFEDGQT